VRDVRAPSFVVPGARMSLLVLGEGIQETHTLPDRGEVIIGRSGEADIRIDDRSISRRHAKLSLGPPVTIEDLGSANGTRVRGDAIKPNRPVTIAVGETVDLGTAMIIVQARATSSRPRRFWAHGYFEARLEDECARAERGGAGFALVRVHCAGEPPHETVEQTLAEALRPVDVVGTYAPGEYEALLVDTDPPQAERAAGEVVRRLGERGVRAKAGVACWPRDGRSPEALVAHACDEAQERPAAQSPPGAPFVVADGTMQHLHRLVSRVASGTISVLILGETGVGKEVLAETVHRLSPRKDRPFLRLNCAALSESLLESELFGHERGAFTGAVQAKPGLLETADGGTVFLDEIGELPMSTQVKLLRVLEERQVLRVGSLKPRPIDVRFVAATNRDLEAEIERGTFRRDLYYRLNGISLMIPPLRERVSEIEGLARAFVQNACRQAGRGRPPALAADALELLGRYSWPGNIRELRNVIERAVLLAGDGDIGVEHLPVEKLRATLAHPSRPDLASFAPPAPAADPPATESARLRADLEAAWRQHIVDALAKTGGNQTEAARLLGISRRTLLTRLDQYAISRPRKGRAK
jgi:DNA-binding NtrC family response regulator